MKPQITDFTELQELKNQFSLLDQKLEKQRILNEELLKESMQQKLSSIERWYKNRFYLDTIGASVLTIMFIIFEYHWGFILLMDAIAITEYILDRKAYHILDPKNLPHLSMAKATENVKKHRQYRYMIIKIMILPLILLIGWTILIACNYTFYLDQIAFIGFLLIISINWGIYQMKTNNKKIEEVLKQIGSNE